MGSGGTGIGTVELPLRVPLAAPLLPRPTKQLSLFDSKVIRPHTLIADARNDMFPSHSGKHPLTSSLALDSAHSWENPILNLDEIF